MKLRIQCMLVSLATTVLDWGLFLLCTLIWTGALALVFARAFCACLGALGNFVLNRAWVFQGSQSAPMCQARRYALVASLAVFLATGCFWIIRTLTGWDPKLIHPVSMAFVWLGFTFPMLRRWVFLTRNNT